MNDFTKEELEEILAGLMGYIAGNDSKHYESIMIKINDMIQNYCEHKKIKGESYLEESTNFPFLRYKCSECEKILLQ